MARLMIYEGSDEEIRKYLSSLPPHTYGGPSGANSPEASTGKGPSHLDQVARDFRTRLEGAAAGGRKGQMDAMLRWLKRDGVIELTELWQASGVANQHDYGGIGSSLTRNMKRAGGSKTWYTAKRHSTKASEWVYTIVPELIEPLKRAFLN